MSEKIFEFPSAIRGFHYYRKYWQPKLEDELYCRHEEDNPFDFFAIKICMKNTGVTVGHLPMEISRPTKFLLERGATAFVKLTSTNYCVSPLVQGGLEIPCRVEILMAQTLKNKEIINIYKDMVDLCYDSREKDSVVGSFLSTCEEAATGNKRKSVTKNSQREKSDIRSFFPIRSTGSSTTMQSDIDMVIDTPIIIHD